MHEVSEHGFMRAWSYGLTWSKSNNWFAGSVLSLAISYSAVHVAWRG